MIRENKFFGKMLTVVLLLALILANIFSDVAYANDGSYGLAMSPLNQVMVLYPGERYVGSFDIINPNSNTVDFNYVASARPFFVDEEYHIYYSETEGLNQLVDWITVQNTEGLLHPNESATVHFVINVPQNAPSGGQYAAITVYSQETDDMTGDGMGLQIKQPMGMAYIIYAEIAGTTERKGEVQSIDVPGILFDGNIYGSASIRNVGNVHGEAKYTLQVWPLFSNEEIYTNEEEPNTDLILPNRVLYHETAWESTPWFGVFNVVYTVEFEGVTTQVKKMVIKCPIWLLFIIIFAIAAIIIYFFARAKARKSKKRVSAE